MWTSLVVVQNLFIYLVGVRVSLLGEGRGIYAHWASFMRGHHSKLAVNELHNMPHLSVYQNTSVMYLEAPPSIYGFC